MHCVDKTKGGELLPHAYMTAYTCSFYEKCHSAKETDFGVCWCVCVHCAVIYLLQMIAYDKGFLLFFLSVGWIFAMLYIHAKNDSNSQIVLTNCTSYTCFTYIVSVFNVHQQFKLLTKHEFCCGF